MTRLNADPPQSIRVTAPARLHLGFVDLDGGLGRRFGSIGLTLEAPATVVSLRQAGADVASGPDSQRAVGHLAMLRRAWGVDAPVALSVERAIPPHAGLGSGTQLGLAVGLGLARLHGIPATPEAVAAILDRGARSGIGVAAFARGGFLVDGGKAPADTAPPPAIARLPFPEDWRVLLIQDHAVRGVHGVAETAAFDELPPFQPALAAHLCRLVLMRLLPGIARADIEAAGTAVAEIQRAVGDHFAPFQGGGRFTSPQVAEVLGWLDRKGIAGLGQSSWGPTGFALLPDRAAAGRLAAEAGERFAGSGLDFRVVAGRNRPGAIETVGREAER
ncbi:MAG TPA: GHMP kinase [Geminicoccaceae bacterium]|nr:GHMP kinase [Geminicoccus sp.]HMU49523.1 GHMP kinase [Geminicoccaceae bacterium]